MPYFVFSLIAVSCITLMLTSHYQQTTSPQPKKSLRIHTINNESLNPSLMHTPRLEKTSRTTITIETYATVHAKSVLLSSLFGSVPLTIIRNEIQNVLSEYQVTFSELDEFEKNYSGNQLQDAIYSALFEHRHGTWLPNDLQQQLNYQSAF